MWYLKIFLKTNVRQWNIVCLFLFRKKAKIVFSSLLPVISKIDNCQILISFSVATHSSVLAWRVPGTGEPGGLPSVGSHGVGHDWSDLAAVAAAMSFSHGYIFPFLLCFSLPFFSQLFIRPPQTAILLFCNSFPWGWSWSLSLVQCHKPPSTVHQVLCLSDIVPYIYFSLLLYNHKRFNLGHTWMV